MTPQEAAELMRLATHPKISRIDCLRMARDNMPADVGPERLLDVAKIYDDFFNNQKF